MHDAASGSPHKGAADSAWSTLAHPRQDTPSHLFRVKRAVTVLPVRRAGGGGGVAAPPPPEPPDPPDPPPDPPPPEPPDPPLDPPDPPLDPPGEGA